jgi:hypothetical protein
VAVPLEGKRDFRRRTVVAVAAVGFLIVAVLAVVYRTLNTTSVTVLNDGQQPTRLSGCVDDSLDLDPGTRAPIDVASDGRTGCNVFVGGEYEGCLIVDPRTGRTREPVEIHRGVHREVPQSRCEALN